MILVVTGTHPQQFNRLLRNVDLLIKNKIVKEIVIMQTGYSDYVPKYAKWFRFTGYENMLQLLRRASIVITHGGIGSVLLSIKLHKKTIVMPRLRKFNEHTNDHQLEIVHELSKQNKIIPVYDTIQLIDAINKSKFFLPIKTTRNTKILNAISTFLENLEGSYA